MGIAMLVVVLLGILWGAIVLMRRARGSEVSASGFGAFDELFHPAAQRATVIIEEQQESAPPVPSPDE